MLSQLLSSSLVGLNQGFSRWYLSPCASIETVHTHSVSYQALLSLHAADSQRLVAHLRDVENSWSLVSAVHRLPLVKGRNNKSSPKATLLNSAPNQIGRWHNHLVLAQSFLLCSAKRLKSKRTKQTVNTNDSTFSHKQNQNKTNDNVILSHTVCMYICAYTHTPHVTYSNT